ncbi:MAG: response regulator [Deltaproteobacteria bacterium]|nr:MAG: response regulator [Deltaproteobacteria bacterium]
MRALIVDDERLARAELRRLLAAHPDIEIVGEAAHADEARDRIAQLAPDLLLLDIEMPGASAFDLLASLDAAPAVIFTTAFDAHAVRAFEVSALDYLLKPIDPTRLAAALERAVEAFRPAASIDRVFVRDGDRCWFVRLSDVPLIESEGNYARLDIAGQPLLPRSLAYLEARLQPAFFRASRKHLVNLKLVDRVEAVPGGGLVLILPGGKEVEMSRRAAQRFRAKMTV